MTNYKVQAQNNCGKILIKRDLVKIKMFKQWSL